VNVPQLVLASASPRRRELLRQIVAEFEILAADAAEIQTGDLTLREQCALNAHRKARAVAPLRPGAVVLGADTLVGLDGRVLGKPRDSGEARETLRLLQGRAHEVVTGLCLLRAEPRRHALLAVLTRVHFKPLADSQIADYLAKVHVLDKAGSYAIQEHGALIVDHIQGSWSNVVGLPLELLRAELPTWGIPILP